MSEEKYRFVVEWYDDCMQMKRRFLLSFFPSDNSVDMYDTSSKRLFLARMKCDTITADDLFVGSCINLLTRQLFIVDYGDKKTADKFAREVESALFIVNESGFGNLGNIIEVLESNKLSINQGKIVNKERSAAASSLFAPRLQKKFAVFELRGENGKQVVRKLLDPQSPIEKPLKEELKQLSAFCLGPTDTSSVEAEIALFFSDKDPRYDTVQYSHSTCCLIKPHAIRNKCVGVIIQQIINHGFVVSALRVVMFSKAEAAEFYEVYKGVVPEYKSMVTQLTSGVVIALEVTKKTPCKNLFVDFRTYVGPSDPDIARELRPGSLRSVFGEDKVLNGVHCTDLPEDVNLELNYVFRVLPV